MKVKNQTKSVVYTGELSASVSERKNAILGIGSSIRAAETKEISLPQEQLVALKSVRDCLLALKPVDEESGKKSK